LSIHISETRNIPTACRVSAIGAIGFGPVVPGRYDARIAMERDVFAQQSVVVPESVRESAGSGVEQDQVCVQRGGVEKHYSAVIVDGFLGVGIDDAHPYRPALLFVVQNRM